jgi:uncharacterized membrane protein
MNELSQIIFSVLFGLLGLYVIVFWGMGVASLVRSYVHDGEKDYKSFYTSLKWNLWGMSRYGERNESDQVKFLAGFMYPACTLFLLLTLAVVVDAGDGPILLTILCFVVGIWAILRVMRTVVRLSKRLTAHEKDRDAHTGVGK